LNEHDVATISPAARDDALDSAATRVAEATAEAICAEVATARQEAQAETSAPASVETALRVSNLTKSFRSGFLRRRLRGIDDISFSVPAGSIFALLGHNGAGKTTTINCVLDLVRPDQGNVEILGRSHRDRRSRGRLGYLPERPYFFEHLTGHELLAFYAQLHDVPADVATRRIDRILAQVGMTDSADRRLRKYSKGMLQRMGLAQALLADPEILILDEPMSGLDPIGRREVRELLLELRAQGKTIILSSHIVPDVEMLADQVGILREGCLAATRDMSDVSQGTSYRIKVGAPGNHRAIQAADVDELRRQLDHCRQEDIPVLSVEPRKSGLEELFLATHQTLKEER